MGIDSFLSKVIELKLGESGTGIGVKRVVVPF